MRRSIALALATSWLAALAHAEPTEIAAQGRLSSGGGGPVADGSYPMGVALYDAGQGGSALFKELYLGVPVQGGVFALVLGGGDAKLDAGLFGAKPLWVGVTVGTEPELARVPLRRVPTAVHAQVAQIASDLACSGCVASDDLAKGAVTGEKIATGAVGANHVSFHWALGDGPGGAATFALDANKAKLADQATKADTAKSADFAEEAASAKIALSVKCTGCVAASMIGDSAIADLVAAGKLAKVASSGLYADLSGGPDLAPYAKLAAANTWTAGNTFGAELAVKGKTSFGADVDFAAHQALLFRFQNADKEPAACDVAKSGLAFFDTTVNALKVCNGKAWVLVAKQPDPGTSANPASACLAVFAANPAAADGVYVVDPDGPSGANPPFSAYCDVKGGGWTLVAKVDTANKGGADEPNDWFQKAMNTGGLASPAMNVNGGLHSWGTAVWLPYLQATTVARFTVIAQDDVNQKASWHKYAAPAAFAKWFNGDNTPTAVCKDAAMSSGCTNATIASNGDATNLGGMNLTAYGFQGCDLHMRLNNDGAPSYSAVCSCTFDNQGNAWKDSLDTHWGNGLTIWIK